MPRFLDADNAGCKHHKVRPAVSHRDRIYLMLERTTLEAYAGIAIAIIIAMVPMIWELKLLAFIVLAGLATDVAWRSPWTYKWSLINKVIGSAIGLVIVASIGWRPVAKQYLEDNKPTLAAFRIYLTSLRNCEFQSPPHPPNSAAYLLWVDLENTGAPSIGKNWKLSVIPAHESERKAEFLRLGDMVDTPVCGWVDKQGDALEDKTENREISGVARGKLFFLVSDLPHVRASADDTMLMLSVEDKDSREYTLKKLIRDIGPRLIVPPVENPKPTNPPVESPPIPEPPKLPVKTLRGRSRV